MKKNKNLNVVLFCTALILTVIVIVIIAGLCIPADADIIQGQAEITDYRISGKVPARILEIRVNEGDTVAQGDTLVILEAPDIQARLAQAEAALSAARALEQKALTGVRTEQIQQAYETWQRAVASKELAERTYDRMTVCFITV